MESLTSPSFDEIVYITTWNLYFRIYLFIAPRRSQKTTINCPLFSRGGTHFLVLAPTLIYIIIPSIFYFLAVLQTLCTTNVLLREMVVSKYFFTISPKFGLQACALHCSTEWPAAPSSNILYNHRLPMSHQLAQHNTTFLATYFRPIEAVLYKTVNIYWWTLSLANKI